MVNQLQVTEHYVGYEDGHIYYTKSGAGPALVLIHANGGNGRTWDRLLPHFAEHFTCYTVDWFGYGHSDVPTRQYSIDELADGIVAIMNDAGVAKAHLCGTHTGAILSFNIAARYPQRINKLVLDGLTYFDPVGGLEFYYRKVVDVGMSDTTSFDRAVYPKATWEEAKDMNPSSFNSGAGMTQEEWGKGAGLRNLRRYWQRLVYDSVFNYNSVRLALNVTAPIMLTVAETDILRPFARPAHQAIKGSILKDGIGPGRTPDEFFQEALAFLKPDAKKA